MIFGLVTLAIAEPCPFAKRSAINRYERRIQLNRPSFVLDYNSVTTDIEKALTDSKDFWPADFGNYGPLMIRLAWHCSGSYRHSDGRGGCDGGRIRFNPERSWDDNTNLDKALRLLEPIKAKYGDSLSWGDLVVLAGNAAIKSMGGPIFGFCGGRIDDKDGSASLALGPSPQQEAIHKCKVNGNCTVPLGPSTIGLIYVNPEGPMGNPDPKASAPQIREVFSRMGMNDRETVALIGGGHAFGKAHGACPSGPGPNPTQDPTNPWPGTCGEGPLKGKGINTFTSGFEGPWTTTPTKWSNQYFKNLLNYNWIKFIGPAGHNQWKPENSSLPIRMLTADVALLNDPSYLEIVKEYASDVKSLEADFAKAWYKLTTGDMGPVERCKGNNVPPAQPFQLPLPDKSKQAIDFDSVKTSIVDTLYTENRNSIPDKFDGKPYYGALFVNLAYQCMSTYRVTDYSGGCNGARIRLSPEKDYSNNKGMEQVLKVLEPIKTKFGDALSWADLIILAGQVSIENAGGPKVKFNGGRVDAVEQGEVAKLAPRSYYTDPVVAVKDNIEIMGLELKEGIALAARLRSAVQQKRLGFTGSYSQDYKLSNKYFKVLLEEEWVQVSEKEYKSKEKDIYMTDADIALVSDSALKQIVTDFASNQESFQENFRAAWEKLSNADLL